MNMMNGIDHLIHITNQSQMSLVNTLQALVACLEMTTTKTDSLQTPTTISTLTGPSGSLHVKEPHQFTGKTIEVEAFSLSSMLTNILRLQVLSVPITLSDRWYPKIMISSNQEFMC